MDQDQENIPVANESAPKGPKPPKGPKAPAAPKAPPLALRYRLHPDDNYQLSGERLKAHTQAFIAACGAFSGAEMPRWKADIGQSALSYHRAKGNLVTGPTGAPMLTPQGVEFFKTRKGVSSALVESFTKALSTGEAPAGLVKKPLTKL